MLEKFMKGYIFYNTVIPQGFVWKYYLWFLQCDFREHLFEKKIVACYIRHVFVLGNCIDLFLRFSAPWPSLEYSMLLRTTMASDNNNRKNICVPHRLPVFIFYKKYLLRSPALLTDLAGFGDVNYESSRYPFSAFNIFHNCLFNHHLGAF